MLSDSILDLSVSSQWFTVDLSYSLTFSDGSYAYREYVGSSKLVRRSMFSFANVYPKADLEDVYSVFLDLMFITFSAPLAASVAQLTYSFAMATKSTVFSYNVVPITSGWSDVSTVGTSYSLRPLSLSDLGFMLSFAQASMSLLA